MDMLIPGFKGFDSHKICAPDFEGHVYLDKGWLELIRCILVLFLFFLSVATGGRGQDRDLKPQGLEHSPLHFLGCTMQG